MEGLVLLTLSLPATVFQAPSVEIVELLCVFAVKDWRLIHHEDAKDVQFLS